jgi:aspartate/methionine/tyrosine aminotransferase
VDLLHVIDPWAMMPVIEAAFDRADSLREAGLATARAGRAVLADWVNSRADLAWVEPDAGLTAFPRLPEGVTGSEVSRILKAEEETLVVPGRFFEDDRHIRVGVAGGPDVVAEGLHRLGRVLDRLSPR